MPFKGVVMFAFKAKYFTPKPVQVLTEGVGGIKPLHLTSHCAQLIILLQFAVQVQYRQTS